MAYAHTAITSRDIAISQPAARPHRGLMSRLLDALVAARQRQAEREITAFLKSSGGRFTDETERQIERRFLSDPSRF